MANNVRIGVGLQDNASSELDRIRDKFLSLQKQGAAPLVAGAAAAATAYGLNLVTVAADQVKTALENSVNAAADQEAGLSRLTQALKANVPGWDGNIAAIEKSIEKNAALGFSQDDLRNSMTLLSGATHDIAKAQEIQSVAMDLARFKGVDLATATEALVHVEAGRYRGLADLGIKLEKGASQEQALAAVRAVAAGQAEAFGNTTEGAMARANEAIHEVEVSIGKELIPVVKDLANDLVAIGPGAAAGFGVFLHAVEQVLSPLARTVDAVNALSDAVGGVSHTSREGAQALSLLHDQQDKLDQAFQDGTISEGDYETQTRALNAAIANTQQVIDASVRVTSDQARASLNAAEAQDRLSGAFREAAPAADSLAAAAMRAGTGLDISERAAYRADTAVRLAGAAALDAARKFALLNLEARAALTLNTGLASGTADAQARFSGNNGGDKAALDQLNQTWQALQANVKATSTAHGGVSASAKAAAAEVKKDMSAAFTAAKDAARGYYDEAKRLALQDIENTRRAAQARVDAEKRAVTEILDARKALLYQGVNADEKALRDKQAAEQLAHLQSALQAAQQGSNGVVDQQAVTDAQNALDDFQAQQKIDQERAAADAAAAQIGSSTKVSQADINAQIGTDQTTDAAKAAAPGVSLDDLAAQSKTIDEDAKKAVASVTLHYDNLAKSLDKHITSLDNNRKSTDTLTTVNKELAGLFRKYGIAYDPKTGKAAVEGSAKAKTPLGVPAGMDATGGVAQGTTPSSGLPPVFVTLQVEGATTFDPDGSFARRLTAELVRGLQVAWAQQGTTTGTNAASKDVAAHTHPLSSV